MPDFNVILRGYDRDEVDELIGRVEAALESSSPAVTAEQVRSTAFTVVMRGYDPEAVDAAVCDYVALLERRERLSSGQWKIIKTVSQTPTPAG